MGKHHMSKVALPASPAFVQATAFVGGKERAGGGALPYSFDIVSFSLCSTGYEYVWAVH